MLVTCMTYLQYACMLPRQDTYCTTIHLIFIINLFNCSVLYIGFLTNHNGRKQLLQQQQQLKDWNVLLGDGCKTYFT